MTVARNHARPAAVRLDPAFEQLARVNFAASRWTDLDRLVSGERTGLRWAAVGGPIAGFNRLTVTAMDEATVDADLDAALAELDRLPVVSAWIPPGATPDGMAERFVSRGFVADDDRVPAMTADLASAPALEAAPGVTWFEVADPAGMSTALDVMCAGFEIPEPIRPFLDNLLAARAQDPDPRMAVFVAELDGRPASTALAVVDEEIVGIFNVATVPDARGRGLGRFVTLLAMQRGIELGAMTAVLESSDMAHDMYGRLGFRDVGRYQVLIRRRAGAA